MAATRLVRFWRYPQRPPTVNRARGLLGAPGIGVRRPRWSGFGMLYELPRFCRRTSSGRRRSRRECLVGRPRPLNLRGVGAGNGERTRVASPPQGACRATDRSRSPVAASLSLLPSTPPRLRPRAACRRAGRRPSVSRPLGEAPADPVREERIPTLGTERPGRSSQRAQERVVVLFLVAFRKDCGEDADSRR